MTEENTEDMKSQNIVIIIKAITTTQSNELNNEENNEFFTTTPFEYTTEENTKRYEGPNYSD